MIEPTYGTTVVRAARPEPEYIDITAFGDPGIMLMERWRGWVVELWSDWEWVG